VARYVLLKRGEGRDPLGKGLIPPRGGNSDFPGRGKISRVGLGSFHLPPPTGKRPTTHPRKKKINTFMHYNGNEGGVMFKGTGKLGLYLPSKEKWFSACKRERKGKN